MTNPASPCAGDPLLTAAMPAMLMEWTMAFAKRLEIVDGG
jgi:hypothetical protein